MQLLRTMRLRIWRLVSRHFERPQHDYRMAWRAFTEGTVRHLEQPDLCRAVVKLVSRLFEARSVTIWLLDERQENLTFAASTALTKAEATRLRLEPAETARVMAALREHAEPVAADVP